MKLFKVLKHLFHPQRSNNYRPKFLHPRPIFFLSLIAVGFYQLVNVVSAIHPLGGSILGYASNITVAQVIESTNTLRSSSGIGRLSYNDLLGQAAIAKAQNMFTENYWAHTSPTGKEPWDFIRAVGYSYRVAGENLARDFDSTPLMMDAWMNSPTHRANILNPRYKEIGVAVIDGILNGVETTLVVQMFATPDTQSVTSNSSVSVPTVVSTTTITTELKEAESVVAATSPAPTPLNNTISVNSSSSQNTDKEVLSKSVIPQGLLNNGILFSPKHVLKAFFLSIILVLLSVLVYDILVAGHRDSVRFVGKNIAHIMLFLTVMYLIVAFKGGVVGP